MRAQRSLDSYLILQRYNPKIKPRWVRHVVHGLMVLGTAGCSKSEVARDKAFENCWYFYGPETYRVEKCLVLEYGWTIDSARNASVDRSIEERKKRELPKGE